MILAKRRAVVVFLFAALSAAGLAASQTGPTRVQALAAAVPGSVAEELLVLPPDPRPWNEKVAPGLLAAALERRGDVEALVTLRRPDILAEFREVPFDHRDRLRWIARSGDDLERDLRPAGLAVLTRYSHLPVLHVRVPADALPLLAADPRVEAVSPNRVARATRADGKALMRVSQLAAAGYTGAGVTVAVLDTGVDYTHAELSPGGADLAAKTIKGADVIDGDSDPMDGEGHGTAVAGIIAGSSGGVAPAAKVYAVRILDNQGNGTGSQIVAGVNDVVSRVSGGNPLNIKVANMSLGGYFEDGVPPQPCDAEIPELAVPFATLVAAGVLPVVSGGNGGCTTGVAWPACITSTLAVGAVYDANIGSASFTDDQCMPSGCTDSTTAADTIACFSDSGAELDVWAPSFCATTTARGGGQENCFGGTSASAPYASGVAALLTHAVPARSATALHSAMTNSGDDLADTRNGITRKRVRADLALATLQSGCTAPAVPVGVALNKTTVCSAEQFTMSWSPVSGAVSYTVQLATDANFTQLIGLSPTDTFTGVAVNFTLTGAYVGPLYLRVRANASCGASSLYSGAVSLQFTGSNCGGGTYANTYYLSGVARTPGVAPAFWYSDTAILNAGTSSVQLRIGFNGVNSTPAPVLLTLAAHQQVTWSDVLLQAFGSTTNDAGVIVVESTGPVIVLGRTYAKTSPTALSYGSAYPGMTSSQALAAGQVGYLAGLRSDANFRTNVEAVNVGTANATVEFRFLTNSGAPIGTVTLADILPGKRASQTRALTSGQAAAFAEVRVTPAGARVLAFATVMDADANATDPTTIELRIP